MKKILAILVGIGTLIGFDAGATLITFDDAPAILPLKIKDGYAGFDWKNTYLCPNAYLLKNVFGYGTVGQDAGQEKRLDAGTQHGIVSHANSGLGIGTTTISAIGNKPFTFNSGNFNEVGRLGSSSWYGLEIDGYSNGVLVDSQKFVMKPNCPMLITLNWTDLDQISFTSSGSPFVIMDNLKVNDPVATPVPEPATWISGMGVGLLMLGGFLRRMRK